MGKLLLLEEPGVGPAETLNAAAEILPGWSLETGDVVDGHTALITVKSPVNAEMMEKLRGGIVSVAFTGFDHVDTSAARDFGVAVANVPGYSTPGVAELAFSLAVRSLRDPDRRFGLELHGKTVGIIGTGEIGIATAGLFRAAGCRILGWSRSMRKDFSGEYARLETLLGESDIVSLHLPLGPETWNFMDREKLGMMKKGAILVNTSRGAVVDQKALEEMIVSGDLGGAGLDVTVPEPLPDGHPLRDLPGVAVTPHIGYRTEEAVRRRTREALMNISSWEHGERRNRVD